MRPRVRIKHIISTRFSAIRVNEYVSFVGMDKIFDPTEEGYGWNFLVKTPSNTKMVSIAEMIKYLEKIQNDTSN